MNQSKKFSYIIVGFALFSMFFGSGNLIFPLFMGQIAQDHWIVATIGFILTAVILPFLGTFTMVYYRGNYAKFFSCLGSFWSFFLICILLAVWIPLGCSPRCITLAYSSLEKHFTMMPLWMFSIAYCLLTGWIVAKRSKMLDILGGILTPLLLLCILLIVVFGLKSASDIEPSAFTSNQIFLRGMIEGYNTMDLIASFFFTASIIGTLKTNGSEEKSLQTMLKSGIVGVLLLGLVYIGLILTAAYHAPHLQDISKGHLLVHVANRTLGSEWGVISAIAVVLACFTTSVALVSVYVDFLKEQILKGKYLQAKAMGITLGITFFMSILGLEGISFVTEPILQVCYPILIALMVWNGARHLFAKGQPLETSEGN